MDQELHLGRCELLVIQHADLTGPGIAPGRRSPSRAHAPRPFHDESPGAGIARIPGVGGADGAGADHLVLGQHVVLVGPWAVAA